MMVLHFGQAFCCLSTKTWLSFPHLFYCCFYQRCVFHSLYCPFILRLGSGPGFRLFHPVIGPHVTSAVWVQQPELVRPNLLRCRRRLCLGVGLRAPGVGGRLSVLRQAGALRASEGASDKRAPESDARSPTPGLRAAGSSLPASGAGLRAPGSEPCSPYFQYP